MGSSGRHRSASRCTLLLLCLAFAAIVDAEMVTNPPIHRKHGRYFDRTTCKTSILQQQSENASFTLNNALYFRVDPVTGRFLNGEHNMTVTLHGCNEFCGGWSFYWDAFPRLMTWILPILLLLSNIELSPIDKKRFMTVVHALGDPIDSFWSLIHKIYIWNRLYGIGLRKVEEKMERERLARRARGALGLQRNPNNFFEHEQLGNPEEEEVEEPEETSAHDKARIIATVLSGFEEISGAKIESEDYYHMILRQLGRIGEDDEDETKFEDWRRTARILADARTNEFPRTCLAVGVYIVGLVAAFIPEIGGGNTSPPGGRIACAVFLSWLVPLVLVSNTIGAFTSRRTCLTIMRQFVKRTKLADVVEQTEDVDGQDHAGRDPNEVEIPQDVEENANANRWRKQLTRRPTAQVSPDDISIHSFREESSEVERTSASHLITFSDLADIRLRAYPSQKTQKLKGVNWQTNDISSPPAVEHVEHPYTPEFAPLDRSDTISLLPETTWDDYFESLQWLGSIYTYRPWKVLYLDIDHRTHAHRKNVAMAFFAFLPILVSTAGGFAILYFAVPVGWNCRHIWLLGIFAAWIVSAIWTSVAYVRSKKDAAGHKIWAHILFKDGVIALCGTCMILFSTAGLFNNCWCWSAFMMRREDAYVPLDANKEYEDNAKRIYSIVVGACIALQLGFFVGFMAWWRHGVKLVRWTETRRRQEWRHEMPDGLQYTDENYLLFWYQERHFNEVERRRLSEIPRRASNWI